MLLTKHQQAKSLWPHKQADVLLTKDQQAKPLWPQKQDNAAEAKSRTLKLGMTTVAHNSTQRDNFDILMHFDCQLLLHLPAAQVLRKCQHNEAFLEASGMCYLLQFI